MLQFHTFSFPFDQPNSILNQPVINAAISVLSAFLETEVHKEDTLGDFLFEWLDVGLAVSEDCLHLAVNTPR